MSRRSIPVAGTVGVSLAICGLLGPVGRAGDNVWTNGTGNLTWNTTSANWTSPVVWNNANADVALFGAAGVGVINVPVVTTVRGLRFDASGYTLSGNIINFANAGSGSVAAGEIQVNAASATLGSIIIANGGFTSLTKTGAGTLFLTGNSFNSFGSTTISAGVLSVGNGGTTGVIGSSSSSVINNAQLHFNRSDDVTNSEQISGTGSVTKLGAGTLILTNQSTYTGLTTISAGKLQLGNGTTAAGQIVSDVLNNSILEFNHGNNTVIYEGAVSGGGSVIKSGTGNLRLSGNFSHTGGTTVQAGTLRIGQNNQTPTFAGPIVNNALVEWLSFNDTTHAGVISGPGAVTKLNAANLPTTLTLTGDNTYTGLTTVGFGTLQVGNGGTTGAVAGNILNQATVAFNRSNATSYAGVISGPGAVNKLGTGTLTFTTAHTYTGATTIQSGTLTLTGTASIANSTTIRVNAGQSFNIAAVTGGLNHDGTRFALATGQTLTGPGTVIGGMNVRNGATVTPGGGLGTSNVIGNVDFQPGSTLALSLNGSANTDADRGRLVSTGAVTFTGTAASPFTVSVSNAGAFAAATPATFTVLDATAIGSSGLDAPLAVTVGAGGTASATNASNVRLFVSGFVAGEQFILARSGGDLVLQFVPVPEPVCLIGVAAFALALGARLRRRFEIA
jgi:autotransporter-associated beta strand protein